MLVNLEIEVNKTAAIATHFCGVLTSLAIASAIINSTIGKHLAGNLILCTFGKHYEILL
jgi:hypothetical protein